jgi:hypothetical protein
MKRIKASDTSKKTTAAKSKLLITRSCGKKYEKTKSTASPAATIKNLEDR